MNTLNKIKHSSVIYAMCVLLFCIPGNSFAQRFGHGGGGGGGFRGGGGGGFRGASGGGAHTPTQVFGGRGGGAVVHDGGGFNGGSRNPGNHFWGGGNGFRGGDGGHRFGAIGHSEGAYHHVYGYHPYFYHPYHPYAWGPYWHPFGYFTAALATDAILLSIANQQYYYDDGIYYQPSGSGYSVVAPPIGATVSYLPDGYLNIPMNDGGTYYYYGGAFYVGSGRSYKVVPAPVGAIVTELPEGATEQVINGEHYLLYNNTYYQPISQDGQDAYEVVQVN